MIVNENDFLRQALGLDVFCDKNILSVNVDLSVLRPINQRLNAILNAMHYFALIYAEKRSTVFCCCVLDTWLYTFNVVAISVCLNLC